MQTHTNILKRKYEKIATFIEERDYTITIITITIITIIIALLITLIST
jgi:hypothetical protein